MITRSSSIISILSLAVGVLITACSSALQAETTEEAYLRFARNISGLDYGDFLYQRTDSFLFASNPDLKASSENLDQAMAVGTTLNELSELAKHPEPKVRTLALMRLYNMEEPAALRVIYARSGDMAEAFPSRSFLTQDHESDRMLLDTQPITVGSLASLMLKQADFPVRWLGDPATGGSIEEWIGWYEYLYFRATGRTDPILKERFPKMVAVRRKIDALPPVTRAWMLLAIGTIDLHTNENRDPRENLAPLFATEEELIAAAKQLGPDVLLAFLRDGTRTGLRDPKSDDATKGRGFIIAHAGELFREQDAEVLKSMGEIVAACDAKPTMASLWIREELDRCDKERSGYGKGKVLAALLDLCGDRERDFIVGLFYVGLGKDDSSYEQQEFIRELKRRKPKEWKNTFQKIVEHSEFEHLGHLTVVYFTSLTAKLGNARIPTNQDNRNLPLPEIRNLLRTYFRLPEVNYRLLQEKIEFVKPPVLTVKLPGPAEFIELNPDGTIVAVIPREGHVRLLSIIDGKPLADLATEGEVRTVHFGKSNGRLLTLNRDRLLQTWDIATAKEISRTQSDALATYYDAIFSSSGEFLVTAPHQSYAVIDLESVKARWEIEMRTRGNGMFRLSPDDQRLAINDGFGKTILFYDIATGKPIAPLDGHADVPLWSAFSPDGNVFVSWANDNEIIVWNGKTGGFQYKFTCPSGIIPWLIFTADSQHMFCSTEQRQIALFNVETGIATRAFSHSPEFGGQDRFSPIALRISQDGKQLIALAQVSTGKRGQADTYLERWDLKP